MGLLFLRIFRQIVVGFECVRRHSDSNTGGWWEVIRVQERTHIRRRDVTGHTGRTTEHSQEAGRQLKGHTNASHSYSHTFGGHIKRRVGKKRREKKRERKEYKLISIVCSICKTNTQSKCDYERVKWSGMIKLAEQTVGWCSR